MFCVYMFHDMVIPTGEGPDCEYMNPPSFKQKTQQVMPIHALLSLMAGVK